MCAVESPDRTLAFVLNTVCELRRLVSSSIHRVRSQPRDDTW